MSQQRDVRVPLFDILNAGEAIQRYVRGKDFHDYLSDELLRDGVERRFSIIGEALIRATKIDPQLSVTERIGFIGFRHKLAHGYDIVNHEEVWRIVQNDLPLLLSEVRILLGPSPA